MPSEKLPVFRKNTVVAPAIGRVSTVSQSPIFHNDSWRTGTLSGSPVIRAANATSAVESVGEDAASTCTTPFSRAIFIAFSPSSATTSRSPV